jgi:hypothetical protein
MLIIIVEQSNYMQACTATQLLCPLAFYLGSIKRRIIEPLRARIIEPLRARIIEPLRARIITPLRALTRKILSTNIGDSNTEGALRLDSL